MIHTGIEAEQSLIDALTPALGSQRKSRFIPTQASTFGSTCRAAGAYPSKSNTYPSSPSTDYGKSSTSMEPPNSGSSRRPPIHQGRCRQQNYRRCPKLSAQCRMGMARSSRPHARGCPRTVRRCRHRDDLLPAPRNLDPFSGEVVSGRSADLLLNPDKPVRVREIAKRIGRSLKHSLRGGRPTSRN